MKFWCSGITSVLMVLSLFGSACVERQPDETAIAAPDARALFEEIYTHLEEGDTGEALNLLRYAVAELPDGIDKQNAFALKVDLLLREDRVEEAQEIYIDALTADPECAERAHGMIEQYLELDDDETLLLGWVQRVLRAEPPPALQTAYLQSELLILQRDADIEEVCKALDRYSAEFDPAIIESVTFALAEKLIQDRQLDDAERLQQWLTAAADRDEIYLRASALLETELVMARNSWELFNDSAQRALMMLDEREAGTRFARWLRGARRARQVDVADRLAAQTLTWHERFPVTAALAARWYLSIPWDQGDGEEALTRFKRLSVGGGLPPQYLTPLIGWMSNVIFSDGTQEQSVKFLKISDALPWSEIADDARSRFLGILLDISFNAADYDRSIAFLDEGLPQYDAEWHKLMRNKVYAHKAEDAGDTDEAIRRFRVFMEDIAAEMEGEDKQELLDPVSGQRVTPSMILALNARRIGDILSRSDRAEEAAAAYDEAVGYYSRALEEVGAKSAEAAWIRTQLDEMADTQP